jgi:TolA-binding protein
MMDEGDKEKLDAQFSLLDARARKRRRSSIIATIVLVGVTGLLVLRLARDIVDKQAQVQRVEKSRGDLDKQLRTEQEKLDAATAARKKLEAEIEDLEATKKSYQERILSEKDAHNFGLAPQGNQEKNSPAGVWEAGGRVTAGPGDIAVGPPEARESEALLIEEAGKAPEGMYIRPNVMVTPATGSSGREIFKIQLSLDIPEDKQADVERVTYHLSPKYYMKNEIYGWAAPTFEARFNVFACESTVLARVRLRDGTTLAVDFDWCRYNGWPARKKEPVIVTSEDEKFPINPPIATLPPKSPPERTPPTGTASPSTTGQQPSGRIEPR